MLCEIDAMHPNETILMLYDLSGVIPRPDGTFLAVRRRTPRLRLRALALIVWVTFRLFWQARVEKSSMREILDNDVLQNAVRYADLCASAGFYPPVIIRIASWFMTLRARHGADLRYMGVYAQHKPLWDAYDGYRARRLAAEQKRLDKVTRAPNQYRCAADGCGVQAAHKHALRRCAGPCPSDCKPHYCSTDCQQRVSVDAYTTFLH